MSNLSRREFMVSSAAVVGTACVGGLASYAMADPIQASIDHYAGFKMSIQTYSLRQFSFDQALVHIEDLGLRWVELFDGHMPITHDADAIAAFHTKVAAHSAKLSGHFVGAFTGDANHNRNLFEFGKRAGLDLLICDPTPEAFPILHDLVQEYDIKVGIHNHGPGHRYDRIDDSLNAVENFDKRIGFCPDTGHYLRSGEDPVEMVYKLKDRMYGMHLKDQAGKHRNEPPETILGEGAIDLNAFCKALREIKYNATISLEYELNPHSPVEDMRKGLANFAAAAKATA